jgi:hypothetical protein
MQTRQRLELLVPLADQHGAGSSLQSIESWLSDVSSGDLGLARTFWPLQLSFAMLLGLNKSAAVHNGSISTMQHNDSIEKPFAEVQARGHKSDTEAGAWAGSWPAESSQSGLLCCSHAPQYNMSNAFLTAQASRFYSVWAMQCCLGLQNCCADHTTSCLITVLAAIKRLKCGILVWACTPNGLVPRG